ncbi:histidinol dehydrogenase [Methanothermus fervidus DSM 2088]|uniref:Histidinol dehydrogenase n=1 Tax=Methanothermus fervidus (strain ATCC 43054 / DSM 2088 / JCM 10308 / V24 S) TaxID=523846 RepID=E3GYK7_METFV|nr:histidinol dehydrogenase [Methanothermus fervidus]ADP77389.1 histidinol dehydrogenase [Methanothermus fervidus DSM 2088]
MEVVVFKKEKIENLIKRSEIDISTVIPKVSEIIREVKECGDEALINLTRKFDGVEIDKIKVTKDEIKRSYKRLDDSIIHALKKASKNIKKFHERQIPKEWFINNDIYAGQIIRPIESVGCYIPGGRAVYPSTALMTIIPAKVAGVKRVVCCTPPQENGFVDDATLVAADIAGADEIYKVGGVQAIAALAYGTETIRPVNKIVGPGNIFVTAAKKLVYGDVDIDFLAGPSEVLIIADENAKEEYITAEMLAQAEHDPQASSVLVTNSTKIANNVRSLIKKKIKKYKRREIIEKSLKENGKIVITKNIRESIDFANKYAPEHLVLMVKNPEKYLKYINNAGSIFLGDNTPVSAGDYGLGSNHVLPTGGFAKACGGLSTESFIKKITVQKLSKKGLLSLKDIVIPLSEYEGLDGHAKSFKKRLEVLKSEHDKC